MNHNTSVLAAALILVIAALACSPSRDQSLNAKKLLDAQELVNSLGQKPDLQRLSSLTPEKREYALSLLALFIPQAALDYLHTRPTLDPQEAQIAVLALKIQNQDPAVILKQEESWIFSTSPFEKTIQSMTLPNPKEPVPQFREEVKVLVTTTRRLRGELTSAIMDKPPQIQLKIMEADRALEQRVGQFIRTSPPPRGMPKKLVNYRQGMINIAQEFFAQANEISKLEVPIQENMKQLRASEKNPAVPSSTGMGPDLKKWPWPQGFLAGERGFEPLNKAFSEKNYLAALILADSLRGNLLKDESDYYSVRAGLLLMHSNDDAMRRYVFEELTKAKQDALLLKWKQSV